MVISRYVSGVYWLGWLKLRSSRLRWTLSALPLLCAVGCGEQGDGGPAIHVGWSVAITGQGSHKVESLATDGEGNVIATGTFDGVLELEGVNVTAQDLDIFVGKWDSLGHLLWLKTFGGPGDEQAHGVAVDAAGSVYVTGFFSQSIDFGTGPLTASASQTVFLAKLDANGGAVWANPFGSQRYQAGYCIAIDGTGRVVIAGEFVSTINFGGTDLVSAGLSDVFVAAFDSDGNHLISKSFGDETAQHVSALTLDADGNIAILGGFQGVVDFGGGDLTGGQGTFLSLYVVKFDSQLNHIWSRNALPHMDHAQHAHDQGESGHSLALDGDSNVLFQGSYSLGQTMAGQDLEAPSAPHGVLVEYARDGEPRLTRSLGSSGVQDEGAVALDPGGNRWLGVSFLDEIDIDGASALTSSGGRDVALMELDKQGKLIRSASYGVRARSEIAWSVAASGDAVTVGGWSRALNEIGMEQGLIVQFLP